MSDTQDHTRTGSAAMQLKRDQRGWIVAAVVAFVGVVFIGPAVASAAERSRVLGQRTRRRVRRLGGGTIAPLRRRVSALTR